ncbi:MAG TPA: pyridoxamine 5'-phosphate oxidase family protein [Nitrososphaerales archaeon]|nr:pyridoxamine 5'-phosphate oxidase family protein [Nitrososphaerales archaeon]
MVKVNLKNKTREKFLVQGLPKLLRLAVILDGKPHVSSVWYQWSRNHFWVSTSEDRLKVRAIKKNPKVAFVVDSDTMPYEGVIVEGEAVLTKKNVKGITLAIVRKYIEKKRVQEQYDSLMRAPRILIKIKPAKSIDIMSYREH